MHEINTLEKIEDLRKENKKHAQYVDWVLNIKKKHVERCGNTVTTEYERGVKDTWDLIHKLELEFTVGQLVSIFGQNCVSDILNYYTYDEIKNEIEEYEKSKLVKPVDVDDNELIMGDIINCISNRFIGDIHTVMYICKRNGCVIAVSNDEHKIKYFDSGYWTINKTGKHIDLEW